MKYQAVLFDLDGTLVDSVPDIAHAANAMLKAMSRETLPLADLRNFVGKGTAVLIKRALCAQLNYIEPEPALFEQAEAFFNTFYHQSNGTQSELYPNVLSGLARLQEKGLKLGIVTNKPEQFTLPLVQKTGLAPFFDIVVSGDTCALKKPHPDQLFYACQKLGVEVENTVFIGDSLNDTQAANAANMDVLVLPYGYNEGKSVQNLTVNAIVEDISFAADWIFSQN
ncbi:phosphoglycolate phosphatase [Pelistega suis]|uniref:Phosphoglycolate phosphatase n=1 Tax=Pelistega suis TaxID=1631957 RepID=A0A849P191_9BURK|nr:phosphoglycolate phosphatase [Pelistega suis]NOL50776.1 phosphoglycolate phosphatase [Pelistega suis]